MEAAVLTPQAPVARMLALSMPIVAAACLTLIVAAAESGGLEPWSDTRPRNAAEAAALGRGADLVRFLRRGAHPEQIYPIRAGLVPQAPASLSAMEAAVWPDGSAMIGLLEREGAVFTNEGRRQLACLARDLGRPGTVTVLVPDGDLSCAPGQALDVLRLRGGAAP